MLTRRLAAAFLVTLSLGLTACANNVEPGAAPAAPAPSSSDIIDLPPVSVEPSGKPTAGGAQTITGKVTQGVEPNCLLLQDSTGSHLLVFDDPAMKATAKVGADITLVGRSEPKMMSTCQQGVPFIVTSVGGS
ncbi:hypothetical protein ACWKSP_23525 [Micromonosporaceae bacterium Da 78-11]